MRLKAASNVLNKACHKVDLEALACDGVEAEVGEAPCCEDVPGGDVPGADDVLQGGGEGIAVYTAVNIMIRSLN